MSLINFFTTRLIITVNVANITIITLLLLHLNGTSPWKPATPPPPRYKQISTSNIL